MYKNRKSIRLKDYDYSKNGYYFITIVTENREKYLSEINCKNEVILSEIGKEIENSILFINSNQINVDKYIIMPNHIHIILILENSEKSIIEIIKNFKKFTSNNIKQNYNKKLWQKSYFDKIIRSEKQYLALCEYIESNPLKWNLDKYY
ncbi:REP-associated tyrosine transposase [Peptoniphilus stercorisuis]|uniref:REP element-mobilizing transposase RayT n=1 Tax=Peptoniphilus stercorisuis TaxID=1436965 RepID=A0ABS4KAR6_9FIRM|nr:transposase [Peptoniphilus stercorisuis]MBP2024869.1 REP element-mobilizing transposase RayT [Peptoniphilus stercorisuis]